MINEVKRRREPYFDLKVYMAKNKIKQKDLAKHLNKSVSALNQNLNGTGGDFSLNEVRKLILELNIPSEYFFKLQVPKTEQNKQPS